MTAAVSRLSYRLGSAVVAVLVALFACAFDVEAREPLAGHSAFSKYVDEKGNITLPKNFATDWTFMGTWAVVEDGKVADLHNVYVPKEVIEAYRATGDFEDGAVVVKEVRHARGAEHTTGQAYWVEGVKVWFVMVRDKIGRFPNNPLWGDGWGWALFNGDQPDKQVATDYRTDCLGCHVPAQKTNWFYVYAYPLLGADAAKHAPPPETTGKAEPAGAGQKPAAAANSPPNTAQLVEQGREIYKRCSTCHPLDKGKNGIGPSLWNIYSSKAGAVPGYAYTQALKNSGVTWSEENLDKHLLDVPGFIPGNRMGKLYKNGVKDASERKAVIEYLKSLR